MESFASFIVRRKKAVIGVFAALALICAVLQSFVSINYNMASYLPPDARSTKALDIMDAEFTQTLPNASVMIRDVSLMEAMEYKRLLAEIPGISEVLWLDDMVDILRPLEMYEPDVVEGFYKNGTALYSVAVREGAEIETTQSVQALIGEGNAFAGEAPDTATGQNATSSEALSAMLFLMPVIILILVLSSGSWAEPALFLANIGVAVLINMGTGVFLDSVSFMSYSVGPILQLACSLDYGIFLMHSFAANREKYADVNEAMKHSIRESLPTIAASSITTLFGFLALTFMNFRIGADLGLNLAKGIILSFIAAVTFLPAVTLAAYKLIDKTRHRPLMSEFKNIHRVLSKAAAPMIALVAILIVPCFLGQGQTGFVYGAESVAPQSRTYRDNLAIREEFGSETAAVLLVPRGDAVKERELCAALEELSHVTGVMSYVNYVGEAVPDEFLQADTRARFYGENYARIIVYTDTASEGDQAFQTVERIQQAGRDHYGEEAYSLGRSVTLYEMKMLVQRDNSYVNLIAVFSIFVVLLITFRSALLPILLILTIETGIWVNLSIPYFLGTEINFVGYLVISTVQLGATVDYAILLTTSYMRNRKLLPKREAIHSALGQSFKSILVSGITLASAGFILNATSTNPIVGDIGALLCRGTIFSMLMVSCFLPAMLTILDRVIEKTTLRPGFFKNS